MLAVVLLIFCTLKDIDCPKKILVFNGKNFN